MKKELTIFKELKERFEEKLEKTENEKILIEEEVSGIKDFLNTENEEKVFNVSGGKTITQRKIYPEDTIYVDYYNKRTLKHEFRNIRINGSKYQPKFRGEKHEFDYNQTKELFHYHEWLNDSLVKELDDGIIEDREEKSGLNIGQRLLMLKYMGVNFNDNDDSKWARIIAPIINRNFNDVRKGLGKLKTDNSKMIKNSKNLNAILKIFEEQSFHDIASQIRQDIKSLK